MYPSLGFAWGRRRTGCEEAHHRAGLQAESSAPSRARHGGGPGRRRAGGASLCVSFSFGLWALLIPGGTMPAAPWLCPDRRGSGWTLGGVGPPQREGSRAVKSLIKGRQLPEGGMREASLADQPLWAWYLHHQSVHLQSRRGQAPRATGEASKPQTGLSNHPRSRMKLGPESVSCLPGLTPLTS